MQFPLARTVSALVVLSIAGLGQEGGERRDRKASPEMAPVVIDGRELFSVRGVSSYTAAERAAGIADRVREAAANPSISPDALVLQEEDHLTKIIAGGKVLMSVTDPDSVIADVPRALLATVHQQKIAAAILSYRQERQPRELLMKTLLAVVVLLVTVVLIFATRRGFTALSHTIEHHSKRKLASSKLKPLEIVPAEQLASTLRATVHMVELLVMAAILLVAVEFVLGLYPWTRSLSNWLLALVMDPLRNITMGFIGWLPSLAFLLVLVALVRVALRLMRLYFEALGRGAMWLPGFEREWAMPTFRIVRLLVIAFALVVAYPYLPGSQTEAFKGVSLFLGVVFSLGSSSAIANIIAGYSLTYRRAFKVGDRVSIGDSLGTVTHVRLQATHLKTVKNEEVVYPNSSILTSPVVNYSTLAQRGGLILHTKVGVGYEAPWRQVEAMLLTAAEKTRGVMRQPPPFVLIQDLADFAVTYELNAFVDDPQISEHIYAELHRNILDQFNEYGVQIMVPAYEGDPKQAKVVPRDKWFEKPARPEEDGDSSKEAR